MLFSVKNDVLERHSSGWNHKELEIERLIASTVSEESPLLNEEIFGEELLYIGREIINRDGKRLDILALDKSGCAVIIELKRDRGRLGVETQALQYLSRISQLKGKNFFKELCKGLDENDIDQFLNDGIHIENLNDSARIILVAMQFDKSLYSMGKWLSEQGVSFKCISYEPIEISGQRFLNFSVTFDHTSSATQYGLSFNSIKREKSAFWHNIGLRDQGWWTYLIKKGQISTSWECEPGDRGEEILLN